MNSLHMCCRMIKIITLVFCVTCTSTAIAGEPTEFVKTKVDAVTRLFVHPHTKSRSKDIEVLFAKTIDLDALCHQSFGTLWEARTPEQRQAFIEVLKKMLRANYQAKVGKGTLKKGSYKIVYVKEGLRKERAVVKTKVEVKEESRPIDYRLLKKGGEWVIYDLVLDGVSLVESYREGYKSIVETDGWDELIKLIQEKTAELEMEEKDL